MSNGELTTAPCGCRFGSVDDVFVFNPCSETCNTYAYAVTESRKQGKAILPRIDMSDGGQLSTKPICPHCLQTLDGFTGPKGERPDEGAVAMCFYCTELSLYTADEMLRKPTPLEAVELNADPQIKTMRLLLQKRKQS